MFQLKITDRKHMHIKLPTDMYSKEVIIAANAFSLLKKPYTILWA